MLTCREACACLPKSAITTLRADVRLRAECRATAVEACEHVKLLYRFRSSSSFGWKSGSAGQPAQGRDLNEKGIIILRDLG